MKGDFAFMVFIIGLSLVVLFSNNSNSNNKNENATSTASTSTSRTRTATRAEKPVTTKQVAREIKKVERSVKEVAEDLETLEENKNASVYKGKITMRISGKGSSDPLKEYVTLTASSKNTAPIKITGWSLRSLSTNRSVTIPKGVFLFFPQSTNVDEDIYLHPKAKAIISTGRSLMGQSFQVNICSGYHTQFYSFIPTLQKDCPRAKDEPNNIPTSPANDSCHDFIERFPQCRTQVNALPSNFGAECRAFILDRMNYTSCIALHKDDPGFYTGEWRVFLGRNESLWKTSRETVVLLDDVGKTVATIVVD